MTVISTAEPSAAVSGRGVGSPSNVWQLDRAASHGELSTRHWFWGHRVVPVAFTEGRLKRQTEGFLELHLVLRAVKKDDAAVPLTFEATDFRSVGYGKTIAAGQFHLSGRPVKADFLLHDLGRSPPIDGPVRWFAILSGRLPVGSASEGIWPRLVAGPYLNLYLHTEWVLSARTASGDGAP